MRIQKATRIDFNGSGMLFEQSIMWFVENGQQSIQTKSEKDSLPFIRERRIIKRHLNKKARSFFQSELFDVVSSVFEIMDVS